MRVVGDFIETQNVKFGANSELNFAPMVLTRDYLAKPVYASGEYPPDPHPPLQKKLNFGIFEEDTEDQKSSKKMPNTPKKDRNDPNVVFDNKNMSILKNISTSILSHLNLKTENPITGNPYWMSLDLSYLEITVYKASPLPKFNFLLLKADNFTQFLFKFYNDYSYEIRSFGYRLDGLVGGLVSYSGEGDSIGYG